MVGTLRMLYPVDETSIAAARKFWARLDKAAQELAHLQKMPPEKFAVVDGLAS